MERIWSSMSEVAFRLDPPEQLNIAMATKRRHA
jgi:hypothetical protein